MKKVSMRTLLREPLKVKRMIRSGYAVLITEYGKPLWEIYPAPPEPAPKPTSHARNQKKTVRRKGRVSR